VVPDEKPEAAFIDAAVGDTSVWMAQRDMWRGPASGCDARETADAMCACARCWQLVALLTRAGVAPRDDRAKEVVSSRILLRPSNRERSHYFDRDVLGLPIYREFSPAEDAGGQRTAVPDDAVLLP
jgi:hypothetical protein